MADGTKPATDMGIAELMQWVHLHAHRAEELHERLVGGDAGARDDLLNAIADIAGVCVLAAPVALMDAVDLAQAARGEYTPADVPPPDDLLAGESDWLSSAEDYQGAIWYPFTTEEGL